MSLLSSQKNDFGNLNAVEKRLCGKFPSTGFFFQYFRVLTVDGGFREQVGKIPISPLTQIPVYVHELPGMNSSP